MAELVTGVALAAAEKLMARAVNAPSRATRYPAQSDGRDPYNPFILVCVFALHRGHHGMRIAVTVGDYCARDDYAAANSEHGFGRQQAADSCRQCGCQGTSQHRGCRCVGRRRSDG
jgi:hypothetical protein